MTALPIFRGMAARRALDRFHRQFVRKGDLAFDIGANVGERTHALRRVGARVVAVEPQASVFAALQRTFGGDSEVTLVHAAVGAQACQAVLHLCDEHHECATLSQDFMATYGPKSDLHFSQSETVEVTTLDALVSRHGRPAFVKVDVEGFESQVFEGLGQPIPVIAFEFNRLLLKDTAKCLEILGCLGQAEANYLVYEQMELRLRDWMPLGEFCQQLEQIIQPEILTGEIVVRFAISE